MQNYKIMSCNLRCDCESDGINSFTNRRPFILEKLRKYSPDVIGFQEIRPRMYDWLIENFDEYTFVGGGRGRNRDDEAVCVAFRKDKFYLCDAETFWLSATPDIPGSRYTGDQSPCPRICTSVTLKPRGGDPFRFYNVHTDHVGKVARVLASNQVLQKISSDNEKSLMPFFVTGDFNAPPEDLCITTMLGYPAVKLVDLAEESGFTFHGFGQYADPVNKIDYIFAPADMKHGELVVCCDEKDGVFISDHFPIMVEVTF